MNNDDSIEMDPLALPLTKPALKLGVPMMALYSSMLFCLLGWMVYQVATQDTSLFGILMFVIIWAVLYFSLFLLTFNDAFGLHIAWLNFTYFRRPRSYFFWKNTDSYTP